MKALYNNIMLTLNLSTKHMINVKKDRAVFHMVDPTMSSIVINKRQIISRSTFGKNQ